MPFWAWDDIRGWFLRGHREVVGPLHLNCSGLSEKPATRAPSRREGRRWIRSRDNQRRRSD